MDEPSADFSRGESAEVTLRAGNSRRGPASNSPYKTSAKHEAARVGEANSRCGFVRKKFLCDRSLNDALKSLTEAQRDAANEKLETMIGDLNLEATL